MYRVDETASRQLTILTYRSHLTIVPAKPSIPIA